ncbi:hypothetical protein SAMN05444487_101385 [Marininema mesophilum]|uniref:Uncharacterized protein n=1 Tax=Marininema mesophilum TaxID=1048340 RepID=A0A1H2R4X9_9BACL|nr:hypothetical protein [Marininema mesophilum]SDW14496.1 hypothetical protein SAMN05444487_101385 [Marininema mesophilum]
MDWLFKLVSEFGYLFLILIVYWVGWLIKTFFSKSKSNGKPVRQRKPMNRNRMKKPSSLQQGEHSAEDAYGSAQTAQTLGRDIEIERDRPTNRLHIPLSVDSQRTVVRKKRGRAIPKLSQQGWKQAIIFKEILDPPVARRRRNRMR